MADAIRQAAADDCRRWRARGVEPTLALVRVGRRDDDLAYQDRLVRNCADAGIACRIEEFPAEVEEGVLADAIRALGTDEGVHGILVFRPLPPHIDAARISRAVEPSKDVDGMNPENSARLYTGDPKALVPCTPLAVLAILRHYGIPLAGAEAVVVNRSPVLGKPLAMLLLRENATVTLCHSATRDLAAVTRRADIVVTGIGKAGFFTEEYFKEGSTAIDVGINFDEAGLCGDLDRRLTEAEGAGTGGPRPDNGIEGRGPGAATPVPGGVGAVTSALLLANLLKALADGHPADSRPAEADR